jgi:predicted membrane protein
MEKLTESELAFYRKHPELIQAVGDKATIYRVILIVVFLAGFLLVITSKILKYVLEDASASWLVELSVDLAFELGVALWGGVATTVLLQDLVKRQYSEGRRYQQTIIRQLADEQSRTEMSQAGVTDDHDSF